MLDSFCDTFCSLTRLHKHCCVTKTRPGKEQGKDKSLCLAKTCYHLHHSVTRAPADVTRLTDVVVSSCCCAVWNPSWWEVWKYNRLSRRLESDFKSPWWWTSCARRGRRRRAHRWRPISRWARTWWRVLAPEPRSQRRSRRSKRNPSTTPDK